MAELDVADAPSAVEHPRIDDVGVLLLQVRKASGLCGLLAIERGDGHGWAFPGGYVERGESAEQAAVRELEEETGLIVPDARLLLSHPTPDGTKLLVFSVAHGEMSEADVRAFFKPSREAKNWSVIVDPSRLCFSTHQQAARRWFERFHLSARV